MIYQHGKPSLLLVGALPPPFHGPNINLQEMLHSRIRDVFHVSHLDTSDHRNLDNTGRLEFTNVYLAVKNILQLIWHLLSKRPDIVYICPAANLLPYLRDGLFLLTVRLLSHAKTVLHMRAGMAFRENLYEKANPLVRWFVRESLKDVDIAISLGKVLERNFDGLVGNVVTIPNGTAFDPFKGKTWIAKPLKPEVVVGYLSNLLREKGILVFLEAAKLVVRTHDNVRFKFAGAWMQQESQTRSDALRLISENSLGEKVEFKGVVLNEAKQEFFLTTDIFVFPSWIDSFGMVNIEAMATGCPVIAMRGVGAIEEVVIDGETGILVDPRNPQQLATAIIQLVEDPDLRTRMGRAGRERYEKYYRLEKYIAHMIAVFTSVLEESR